MPCVDNSIVWNQFDVAADHRLGRTKWLLCSLSLTVEASESHITRVTFRLTITLIADLITVKAKRQQNSIGYIIH